MDSDLQALRTYYTIIEILKQAPGMNMVKRHGALQLTYFVWDEDTIKGIGKIRSMFQKPKPS